MQRELSSLPLPPLQRQKLTSFGFHVIEDVIDLKPSELSKGLYTCNLHVQKSDILNVQGQPASQRSNIYEKH